jgi:hypothetical protein
MPGQNQNYILYVMNDHDASAEAVRLSDPEKALVVFLTGANDPKKPDDIKGVPSLLCLKTGKLYTGTQCLFFFKKRRPQIDIDRTSVVSVQFVD